MNTRAKVLNPIIDVVDTGVDLIKGNKKQTLEPVDYSLTSIDELTAPVTKVDDTELSDFQRLYSMEGETITPSPFTFDRQGNISAESLKLEQRGFKKDNRGKIYPADWLQQKENKNWRVKDEYAGIKFDLNMENGLPVSYKVDYTSNKDKFLRDLLLDPIEGPKTKTMNQWELQSHLKNKYGVDINVGAISRMRSKTNMLSPLGDFQKSLKEMNFTEFLKTHPGINKLSAEEIYNLNHPIIKKYREISALNDRSYDEAIKHIGQTRTDLGIGPDRSVISAKLWESGKMENVKGALFHKDNKNVSDALTKFFEADPNRVNLSNKVVAEAIEKEIPGSMDLMSMKSGWMSGGVDFKRLAVWRKDKGFSIPSKDKQKIEGAVHKRIKANPILTEKLNFQTETIGPNGEIILSRKPKDLYTHPSGKTEMLPDGTIVPKESTLIVQAHAYGSGSIINPVSLDQIKRKDIFFPPEVRDLTEAPQFFLTKGLNSTHRGYENSLTKNLIKKYNLLGFDFKVTKQDKNGFGIDGEWTGSLNTKLGNNAKAELQRLDNLINDDIKRLENIDAYSLFYNPVTNKVVTYGKPLHEIPNLTNLIQSAKTKKKMPDITLSSGEIEAGITKKNTGGLVRPNMALGGEMAQYTQMESVVPDLNPDEAEMQLAMSFKNPFKLKKTPPLIDDVDTTLKISDQGPGTAKTATQTHKVDAGVGSDSIFYLKSDMELANAVQNKMTPQQWLGYLTKKGVSPTELDEFGLKNLLYNMGGWDEGTKKWTNNKAISKSDLIAAYKNEKPLITYKIHQIEPFEKGVKDFVSFLTKRKSGGSYYHGETAMDDVRGLLNKPQDIAGDTLRLRLSETLKNVSDLKKDWPTSEKAIIADINKTFKQFYGIDDVVKNGIPEGMKIPFYSKNLLDRFNRLRKGEGFYFAKGKGVQHEGTQFMPGGTGYVEIPFTYNPNPKGKRANEPGFTFGEGHFTNPEGNNPVFWMRASERTDEQGNRILFIEEIQSDMHQKVKQKPDTFSYAKRHDTPGMVDRNMALKQIDNLKLELGKVTDQIDKITGHTDPSAATIMERLKVKREAIRNQLSELQNSIQEAAKKDDSLFPEGPFKKSENQTKIALKTAINLATKEGFDGVAIITGKAKNKFANASGEVAKGNLGFYDQIAVKAMKSTAKNLDLDFSATNIKDGEGNTWAKIPVINLKESTINTSVDMYKAEGGYIHRPSFVDVIPTL